MRIALVLLITDPLKRFDEAAVQIGTNSKLYRFHYHSNLHDQHQVAMRNGLWSNLEMRIALVLLETNLLRRYDKAVIHRATNTNFYRFHYHKDLHDQYQVGRRILPSRRQPFVHQPSRERVKTCNVYSGMKTRMRTVMPKLKRQHYSIWMVQRSAISQSHGEKGIIMCLRNSRYDG